MYSVILLQSTHWYIISSISGRGGGVYCLLWSCKMYYSIRTQVLYASPISWGLWICHSAIAYYPTLSIGCTLPHLFSWVLEYCLLWSYILLHFVQRLYIASFGIVYCCILRGCPQTCLPNPVEGLLEVDKDMVEVFLVQEIFITEDSYVEDLLCSAPSCYEACLFFCNGILRLWLLFSMICCMTWLG